ncbi:MAG: squalene/phytoene synthase family protein [Rickettsiales bacterium]
MIFASKEEYSHYCVQVKNQRYDFFVSLMFIPSHLREVAVAICALDIELMSIHSNVKEEMMGHIRYAWWQEAIESIKNGEIRAQPLIQALARAEINEDIVIPIINSYRENFPDKPSNSDNILRDTIKKYLLSKADKKEIKKWEKSVSIINKHNAKHGNKKNWLLLSRLLFVF